MMSRNNSSVYYLFALGMNVSTKYGPGFVDIVLDEIECSGNETNLLSCMRPFLWIHNCEHDEDVSVDCAEPTKSLFVLA